MSVGGVRVPTSPSWWARNQHGTIEWFEVLEIERSPGEIVLMVWCEPILDFLPVEKFCTPLTRWHGPVSLPWSGGEEG